MISGKPAFKYRSRLPGYIEKYILASELSVIAGEAEKQGDSINSDRFNSLASIAMKEVFPHSQSIELIGE